MIRVTRETDYGIVLLTHIAAEGDGASFAARELAARTRLSPAIVSKVLKRLARAELLASQRGVKGGYRLRRRPEETTIAAIVAARGGPLAITACAGDDAPGNCDREAYCRVRGNWQRINDAIRIALENLTLADMVHPEPPLVALQGYTENPHHAVETT